VPAQVDHRLAPHGRERQRDERPDDPVDLGPQEQGEDDDERVEPQGVPEHLRGDDVALELLEREEQQPHPERGQRVSEQRDEHGRQRAEHRAEVGHELHRPEERPEGEGVRAPVGEDPQQPEDPQRDPRRRAHDQREQELPPHVGEDGLLRAQGEVVLR